MFNLHSLLVIRENVLKTTSIFIILFNVISIDIMPYAYYTTGPHVL